MNSRRGRSRLRASAIAGTALALALFAAARADSEAPGSKTGARPQAPLHDALRGDDTLRDEGDPFDDRRASLDETRRAVERGLRYLAVQQAAHQDGTFGKVEGTQHAPVALAALGALAFMAQGSTPERGEFGAQVSRAVDYLLSKSEPSAGPTQGYIAVNRVDKLGMHGHGYATLALAQAYVMAPSSPRGARIASALDSAVRIIERSQTFEGGWYYQPDAGVLHENSVTVIQLQALRAARNCGVRVDPEVVAKSIRYIERCQNEDGAFRYGLDPTEHPSIAMTASGLATLQNAGRYAGPEIERAVLQLQRALISRDGELRRNPIDFRHYERLNVALALWTYSDQRLYRRWIDDERALVLNEQRADGSWGDESFGSCYATAMTCLFLSIEDGLLPLFER